ncbi:MAG: VWA domain-containing protein [Spirochaetales bacterium]|nr:VWA domain-containing protein [Spirochaetales bacterium]
MTWAYPEFLWLLIAVPVIAFIAWLRSHRSLHEFKRLGLAGLEWQVRMFVRGVCMALFAVFVILAAAGPRGGRRPVSQEQSGMDVAVAFDVSRSMLARDVLPSRLERAATALRQVAAESVDTRFSLIIFKGDAQLAVPMTEDRVMLDTWVDRLGPGLMTSGSTDLEKALRLAWDSFPGGEGRSRVLLLVSDGEALEGQSDDVTRELADAGVPVYVLAAGTAEGSTIPLGDGTYVKDGDGSPVVSRVDVDRLRRIAEDTGGSYLSLQRSGASGELVAALSEKRTFGETRGIGFVSVDRYKSFLGPALLFLLAYLAARIIPWRRS